MSSNDNVTKHDDRLVTLFTEAQSKISESEINSSLIEDNDIDFLKMFDDTNTSVLPSLGSEEIVSLCSVTSDNWGSKRLTRHADLTHNGHYDTFKKNESISSYFSNRPFLYYQNGPFEYGFYGIWTWSAVPNYSDEKKDYVRLQYNTEIDAIEIFTLKNVKNIVDLVTHLKEGIAYHFHCRKVIFATHTSDGQYTGVLCTSNDLNTIEGKTTFSEDCSVLPVYEFTDADVMHLESGLSFYRYAFAGRPTKIYQVKDLFEIVKNIVLSSISWPAYKEKNLTRTQYKTFKNFIAALPIDDITSKIETACHCSDFIAQILLKKFLSMGLSYVDGNGLEDEIICSAISNNTELRRRMQEISRKAWESENEKLLSEAKQKLDHLDKDLQSTKDSLEKTQKSLRQAKAEDERLSAEIAKNTKLAEDVEKEVAARIQKARENAAELIATMAFQPIQATGVAFPSTISSSDTSSYWTFPASEDLDNLAANCSWLEVIKTTEIELIDAGVSASFNTGLAAFLCAAYYQKQPILLVGPNAIDIAKAFSASIFAHKHGMLNCEGNYNRQTVDKIGADGEKIVIINNLIGSTWMNRLPEIFSKKDIFYIATHPYAEDIQVEPRSLYNFLLPIFTEFFVDKKATGAYIGGYSSDNLNLDSKLDVDTRPLPILSKLPISPLVKYNLTNLVNTMHHLYPHAGTDEDFLFAILPIAYASMTLDKLRETMDDQNNFRISATLKHDLQYVLGENDEQV